MTARDELASALKTWRKQAGYAQAKQAAEALEVDPAQLSRWENGKQLPKQQRSKDFARVYKVDRAVVSEMICSAVEEELGDANQALAVVSGLVERIDTMQAALDELLRRGSSG